MKKIPMPILSCYLKRVGTLPVLEKLLAKNPASLPLKMPPLSCDHEAFVSPACPCVSELLMILHLPSLVSYVSCFSGNKTLCLLTTSSSICEPPVVLPGLRTLLVKTVNCQTDLGICFIFFKKVLKLRPSQNWQGRKEVTAQ